MRKFKEGDRVFWEGTPIRPSDFGIVVQPVYHPTDTEYVCVQFDSSKYCLYLPESDLDAVEELNDAHT